MSCGSSPFNPATALPGRSFDACSGSGCEENTPAQCNLEVGAASHPREPGENLFCYYLRLFEILFAGGGGGGGGVTSVTASSPLASSGGATPVISLASPVPLALGGTGASNAAGARLALGIGSLATQAANLVHITGGTITGITDLAIADGGTGASDAAGACANLGAMRGANNLSDLTNLPSARSNLGLGSLARQNAIAVNITGGSIAGINDLAIADGGTGASDASGARANLGLGTMATQPSNLVSITGGSITGITDLAVVDGGTGSSTAAGARTNLGLGSLATINDAPSDGTYYTRRNGVWAAAPAGGGGVTWGTITGTLSDQLDLQAALNARLVAASNLSDLTNAGTARTNLGLGSLATINDAPSDGTYYTRRNGVWVAAPAGGSVTWGTITGTLSDQLDLQAALNARLVAASNLSDLTNAGTARTNLGLGTIATQNANAVAITGGSIAGITDLAVADGGTGASDASGARTNLGLGSIATQSAASVAITGGTITGTNLGVVVNNRAALRALPLYPAGTVITELGYNVPGDGGGGTWVVSRSDVTTVDNDGTLVVRAGSYGTTSTDQSFKRVDAVYNAGAKNVTTMNVRWFGAGTGAFGFGDQVPFNRAFAALGVGAALPGGALYLPAGVYVFSGLLSLDAANYRLDIFGDGGSTEVAFAFAAGTDVNANYAMWHLQNLGQGSEIRDFSLTNRPFVDPSVYPASILRFTGGGGWHLKNITATNGMTSGTTTGLVYSPTVPYTQQPGGVIWIESGATISVENLGVYNCYGTALCIGASGSTPSLSLKNAWLTQNSQPVPGVFSNGVSGTRPTLWIERGNSMRLESVFVENGGPYRTFPASSITSFGSYFVVDTGGVNHNLAAGDYIVINGATGNQTYNSRWRIASVPTATTIRIDSAVAGNEASVLCTSLFACVYVKSATESVMRSIYTNQGGRLLVGSVGVYFCARETNYFNAGLLVDGVYSDYGETSVFVHGRPIAGYTASAILLDSIRANGGPRGPFGGIRVECANDITINSPFMQAALTAYPGALVTPNVGGNWAFTPITAIAISDGGAENPTIYGVADISVAGGQLQSISDSAGISPLVSSAMSVEGTRIRNLKASGNLIDLDSANSTPLQLTGGATRGGTVSGKKVELVNVDFFKNLMSSSYASAATTLTSGVSGFVNFATNIINDLNAWSGGTPTALTVPAGVYRVRLTANLVWAAPPGAQANVQIQKNRASIVAAQSCSDGPYVNLTTPILEVVPGDFFEVSAQYFLGGTLNIGGSVDTFFTMEVVK